MTISKARHFFVVLCALFLFCATVPKAHAELVASDKWGYTIDFPEGFKCDDGSDDETSFLFSHSFMPVSAVIKVWPDEIYKTSVEALSGTFTKLGAKVDDISRVSWRNENCALAQFSMNNAGVNGDQLGWACAAPLPGKNAGIVLLAYAPKEKEYDCEQFILSLIDSLMIDQGSFRESGIVTAFAFPGGRNKNITLTVNGHKITTTIGEEDGEAAQFVVDREFAVFKIYTSTRLWKEAWQRFYRQVARDSCSRLKKMSFDIYAALQDDAKQKDPSNPNAAVAQILLNWVQEFQYERTSKTADKADFMPLPKILDGKGSDCDSRSMLVALILKNMNVNTCMFISRDYSHSMAGAVLTGKQGQTIKIDDTEYIVGETTAKGLTWGKMDAQMQDRAKWIPVEFL
jgi:hypothetical protein